jgi:hypothetical protein
MTTMCPIPRMSLLSSACRSLKPYHRECPFGFAIEGSEISIILRAVLKKLGV